MADAKSYEDQLNDVQQAISEIETHGIETEIEVNGNRRRVKRSDLRTLYQREAFLLQMAERDRRSSITHIIPI